MTHGLDHYLREGLQFFLTHPETTQAALFGTVMTVCWCAESATMLADHSRRRGRTMTNALFAACAFPVQVAAAGLCIGVSQWVQAHHVGLWFRLPQATLIRYGVLFVLLDLLDYVYHVSMHQIPLLWRFHSVHHTDDHVDVSTTVREHPGETAIRNGFLAVWILLTGASLEVLAMRQMVETISNIIAHTALPMDGKLMRWLGFVFITPALHRVHHHRHLPYTNSNYGDVFSVWDRLFGTLARLDRQKTAFGLDTFRSSLGRGFLAAFHLPFVSRQPRPAKPAVVLEPPVSRHGQRAKTAERDEQLGFNIEAAGAR